MSDLIIIKTQHNKHFATINLTALEDKNLSWGAKGLHSYLITRPPNWKTSHRTLTKLAATKGWALKS